MIFFISLLSGNTEDAWFKVRYLTAASLSHLCLAFVSQTSTSVSTLWTASTACASTCPAATCATARQTSSSTPPASAVSVRTPWADNEHKMRFVCFDRNFTSRVVWQTHASETVSWTRWIVAMEAFPAALRSASAWPGRPAAARWAEPGATPVNSALLLTQVWTRKLNSTLNW